MSAVAYTQAPTSGQLLHHRYNEGTGTTASDASGNGNDGQITGAAWVSGQTGTGLSFQGTDHVQVSSTQLNQVSNGLTLSAWVYLSSEPWSWSAIASRQLGSSGDEHYFFGLKNSSARFCVTTTAGSSDCAVGQTVSIGTWHHLVGTYDGSNTRLYVDGQLAFTSAHSGAFSSDTTPLIVGGNINSLNGPVEENLPGVVDNLRIYTRAVTVAEVALLSGEENESAGDTQVPTAPSGVTATAASASQINLSWTASTDNVAVTSYLIERCQGASCSSFAQIATPTTTTYSDTGLTASTSYSYRVRARDAENNLSSYSSTASATTASAADTQAPSVPNAVTATAASATQINLSWTAATDNVAVTGYLIERCQGASCNSFAQIATPTTTVYSDTGLSASTNYGYRVRSRDAANNLSSYSTIASTTTNAGSSSGAPTAGQLLHHRYNEGTGTTASDASGNDNQGQITGAAWVTGQNGMGLSFEGTDHVQVSSTQLNQVSSGLTLSAWVYLSSEPWSWSAIASRQLGSSGDEHYFFGFKNSSVRFCVTTTAGSSDCAVGQTVSIGTWHHLIGTYDGSNTRLYVDGQLAFTSAHSGAFSSDTTPLIIGGNINSLNGPVEENLPGVVDNLRIYTRAVTVAEVALLSGEENESAGDTQAPTAPSGVTATAASASQINLSWTAASDNVAVTGYLIERCQGASCSSFVQIATPTTTTYSDTGLTASTSYSYRVSARDAANNLSGYSVIASAVTQTGGDTQVPTAPSGLSASTTSASQINLSWTAATDNVAVTGYLIERCQGTSCSTFAQIATPTATTYSDAGLSASTSYSYRVRATDAANNLSAYSATASGVTQTPGDTQAPTVPSALTATIVSSTQIALTWSASTDNVGVNNYRVERCQGAGCSAFSQIATPTGTTYTDTSVTAATIYNYRVRAADAANNFSSYASTQTLATPASAGAVGSVSYAYDTLGRLQQVAAANLNAVQHYTYDAAGNILASSVANLSTLSISSFSPMQGPAGAQVTILGSGFSTAASANAVTFNGSAATVVSATSSQLVVSVPTGAISGPVSVAMGSSSVTSSNGFSVTAQSGAPVISGFSPTSGFAGSEVTISGSNFQTDAGLNRVSLNGLWASVVSATSTSLVVRVPAKVASGRFRVSTPLGTAASAGYFVVPPSGYSSASIGATTALIQNGGVSSVTLSAENLIALGFFEATQGEQYVRVLAGGFGSVQVIDPVGTVLGSFSAGSFVDLPPLTRTGIYTVLLIGGSQSGNATMAVAKARVKTLDTTWTNANEGFSGVGQQARFSISGIAGERICFEFANAVPLLSPQGYPKFQLIDEIGSVIWQSSLTSNSVPPALCLPALESAGSYTFAVDPGTGGIGTFYFSAGVGATLEPDAPPVFLAIQPNGPTQAGRTVARVKFQGTAGQTVTLRETHNSAYPSIQNPYTTLYYGSPSNRSSLQTSSLRGPDSSIQIRSLPATATYYFEANSNGHSSPFDIQLLSAPGGEVSVGSSLVLTIPKTGQIGKLTFNAPSTGFIGLQFSPSTSQVLSYAQIAIIAPNGSIAWSTTNTTGVSLLNELTIPLAGLQTGQYSIYVVPAKILYGDGANGTNVTYSYESPPYSQGSTTVTVSTPVTGNLTVGGAALPVATTQVGQSARLTFSKPDGVSQFTFTGTNVSFSSSVIPPGNCRAAIAVYRSGQIGARTYSDIVQQGSSYVGYPNSISPATSGDSNVTIGSLSIPGIYTIELAVMAGCKMSMSARLH